MKIRIISSLLMAALPLISSGTDNGRKLSEDQVRDYGEIGFADIVSYIVEGYQCRWEGMNPEDLGLSPVYRYCSGYAGFAMKDIDGDGLEELLIGDQFEDGSCFLYDILCINRKDASLIHLASGGERDRFAVNSDGTVVETGSNSASDSFTRGFRIRKGKLVRVKAWEESPMDITLEKFSDLAEPEQIAGGFTRQRELSETEMELFRYVTGEGDTVFTPLSVSTQVVAGTNYRFWCRYEGLQKSGHCWITVFKPLPGQGDPQLTSIEEAL